MGTTEETINPIGEETIAETELVATKEGKTETTIREVEETIEIEGPPVGHQIEGKEVQVPIITRTETVEDSKVRKEAEIAAEAGQRETVRK